jgi:hypothetical protein
MNRITGIALIAILLSFLTGHSYAVSMKCEMNTDIDVPQFNPNERMQLQGSGTSHLGIFSSSSLFCETKKGDYFYGDIKYYAPGLYVGNPETLFIHCPLVSSKRIMKRLQKGKSWGVVGPKITVGVALGLDGGIAVNHRLATCFLTGINFQIGAAAGIASIKFDAAKDVDGNAYSSEEHSTKIVQE